MVTNTELFIPHYVVLLGQAHIKINKNPLVEGEPLTLNFTLKNNGDNIYRLIPLSSGFDIFIADLEGNSIYNYRALMGINIYGNDSFVELLPTGELSYEYAINTNNINMEKGKTYLLKSAYSTFGHYINVTGTYWEGGILTNEIEVSVV